LGYIRRNLWHSRDRRQIEPKATFPESHYLGCRPIQTFKSAFACAPRATLAKLKSSAMTARQPSALKR
jgi:hypothetical protein